MASAVKLEMRRLSIELLKSFALFLVIFVGSAYLLLNYWDFWPVFLLGLLWIGPFERPIKIAKLPHTEAKKVWGTTEEDRTGKIFTRFTGVLIHCLFISGITIIGIQLLIALKPELNDILANNFSTSSQILSLGLFSMGVLFFVSMSMPVSIYGDMKQMHPNLKSALLLLPFLVFESITLFFLTSISYVLIFLYHILGIAVALLLANQLLKKWVLQ